MPARPSRAFFFLPLALAAVSAIVVAQVVGRDPRLAVPLAGLGALLVIPAYVGRWRMRRLLMSGDVQRVIGTWTGSVDRIAHAETMAPLLQATAYAAYGWAEAGRKALDRAAKGPAWEAALEQRLFVETLLDAFEGERALAVRKAEALEAMPMPAVGPFARRRITLLRRGIAALARAFAHTSREGDARVLARAAATSPLVHWAMRYAQAIVALDRGTPADVPSILANSPSWPEESAFRAYHEELLQRSALSVQPSA